jgi:pimeloyl-ACP methyl ester carboxylesterase
VNPWKVAGVVAGSGAAIAGGVLVDRRLGRRFRSAAPGGEPPLGSLRGDPVEVQADDGVVLYAEVDEISPYGSTHGSTDGSTHVSTEGSADDTVDDTWVDTTDGRATVVFVHGFSLNLDCWHFQRQAFRGKRRMVFYDQRSHGRSGRSTVENATIDQLGRDLEKVIDTLAPDQPLVLVGHSMGGMSIVALAEQHPELFGDRVVGLGLISTTAGGQQTHKMLSRHIPDAVGRRLVERGLLVAAQRERLLELARRSGSAIAMQVVKEFSFGDAPVPREYVVFLNSMISATPLKVLVEFVPQFDALDKFHVVESFAHVPTLIMCGTEDRLTSIGHARKLSSRLPGARLVELEGGGHMSILEFKDEVDDALEELFGQADELASAGPDEQVAR